MSELVTPSGRRLPASIGGYKVIARLSRGGMGEVLLGQRESHGFNKKVAIKVVLPHVAEDEEFRTLFFDEAKLMARMSHAHVAHVFDFGIDEEHLFMVMEFVDGPSVESIFREHQARGTQMPPELAGSIIAQAARGLHSAHTLTDDEGQPLGVVHRDVSPQNLIVTLAGNTKVLDFGIARSNVRSGQTQVGVVRGKPGYMAPEQAKNRPLDARTDIFQLGVVFYELLTTRELYVRDNMYEAIAAAVEEPVPDVTQEIPGLDPGFQDVLSAALAKNPDERFSTADAMARALDSVIARCGHAVSEAALGDHVRSLQPAPEAAAVSTQSSARTTEDLEAGRATGQSTVDLAVPGEVEGAHGAAGQASAGQGAPLPPPSVQTAQPEVKKISAVQASHETQGIRAPETGIGLVFGNRRRQQGMAAAVVLLALGAAVGWALWPASANEGGGGVDLSAAPGPEPLPPAEPLLTDGGGVPPAAEQPAALDAGTAVATEAAPDPEPPKERRRRRRRRKPTAETQEEPTGAPGAADPEPATAPPPVTAPSPEEPPPAAEKVEEKRAKGTVFVVSDPYAQIFVDGKQRGDTPKLLMLDVGAHVIKLVDPQSGDTWLKRSVTIREGENPQLKAKR